MIVWLAYKEEIYQISASGTCFDTVQRSHRARVELQKLARHEVI